MPRIPRYQRTQTIPGTAGGVEARGAGRVAEAVADTAGIAGETAVRIQRVEAREEEERQRAAALLEEEERHYSTVRLGNQINESALQLQQDRTEIRGVEAFGTMEAVDEWEALTREQHLTGLDDLQMRRDLEAHIDKTTLRLRGALFPHEARERDQAAADTRVQAFESAEKAARNGAGTLDEIMAGYDDIIARDPRLTAEEKEDALVEGESALALAYLEGMVENDPEAAIALIESGSLDDYLDDGEQRDAEKDARKALKAADDSRRLAEKQERARAKAELEAAREKTRNLFVAKGAADMLLPSDVLNSNLSAKEKQQWLDFIAKQEKEIDKELKATETEEEKAEKERKKEEAREAEADLTGQVIEATPDEEQETRQTILDAMHEGRIKPETARTLNNLLDRRQEEDPLKGEQAKVALQRLNRARTDGLFGDADERSAKWAEATLLLQRYVRNSYGQPDYDPDSFVDQLLEEPKDSLWRRVFGDHETEEQRQERLETEAGPRRREERPTLRETPPSAVPPLEKWLSEVRPLNPGVSDKELREHYQQRYGNARNR